MSVRRVFFYELLVLRAAQLAPFVAEGRALAFEKLRAPLGTAREGEQAVDGGEHDVDGGARVLARDELLFPAQHDGFVDGLVRRQKFVKAQQVAAVFVNGSRTALVLSETAKIVFNKLRR